MEINLKNKTAWVFGGSSGIGRAIGIELSKAGANILLIARNNIQLQKAKEGLCVKKNQEHDVLAIDMLKSDDLLFKLKNYRNLNSVDIIINNSGGPPGGPAHTADIEEYSLAFRQHLLAAQVVSQLGISVMKQKQFGRIINIISTSVKQPIPGLGVSNTIRGAVANWSKTLASEVGRFGITVNNILPGATETDRLSGLVKNMAKKNNMSEEIVAKKMKESIPVGRFAQPEEIAYMATFLCSNYASYINGINIPLDGGRTSCL